MYQWGLCAINHNYERPCTTFLLWILSYAFKKSIEPYSWFTCNLLQTNLQIPFCSIDALLVATSYQFSTPYPQGIFLFCTWIHPPCTHILTTSTWIGNVELFTNNKWLIIENVSWLNEYFSYHIPSIIERKK